TTLIRTGVERSSVEGSFKISPQIQKQIHGILIEEDLLDDENFVTLQREFRREGRNVARVNGRIVSLGILKKLGEYLIDLHGQSEHLSLLRVQSHLTLLDRYAEVENELTDYQKTFKELSQVQKELSELRQAETDSAKRLELLKFQIDEIESAGLEEGEEEELKAERTRLANSENLANKASQALEVLDSSDPESPTATDLLGEALGALEVLSSVDESKTTFSTQAQELFDSATDLAREIGDYLEEIEFNPVRLEEVEERIELIQSLKRKYGQDINEIKAFGQKAMDDLDAITNAGERIELLSQKEIDLRAELSKKAILLSSKRHIAAEDLSKQIENELKDLKMDQARFGVDFNSVPDLNGIEISDGEKVAFDVNGYESIEFMVEPNPGEGLKPLVKIASGGETARLMLALKNVLAKADATPTLIFDEIDQGIGGRVGSVVGQKLWNLGQSHQVLCITHLAQLAGFGDAHFRVSKKLEEGRTTTIVTEIKENDRLMELAQMLGDVSEGTLQSANEIVQSVGKIKD
ncbi:MAG: DNA repair protein RecN, partial [Chloroflexi bacterium]|nr:DNA repair protein RecN [Chloroflexota bacterium]